MRDPNMQKKIKYAESLGALNPFGAVRLALPPGYSFLNDPKLHSLNLKDAKKLHRELGVAIRKHERAHSKFVRSLTKNSPFKQVLKGGVWSGAGNEIRGVK